MADKYRGVLELYRDKSAVLSTRPSRTEKNTVLHINDRSEGPRRCSLL